MTAEGDGRSARAATLRAIVLIVLAWALGALPAVTDGSVDSAAKARAWSVARTMSRTGDVVVPEYAGAARLKKPPFVTWVQAAAMRVTSSESIAVAASVTWLLGILFALGPWLLGRALERPGAGLLGSLLLCASRAAGAWGATPEHDLPFAGFVALSLALLARALAPAGTLRHSLGAGLAGGVAVLIKGPFAIAFLLGTAILAVLASRRDPSSPPSRVRWAPLLAGLLAPGLAWLLAVQLRVGDASAVFAEIRRHSVGDAGAHLRPGLLGLVYPLGALVTLGLPWSAAGLAALVDSVVRRRREDAGPDRPSLRLAALALGAILLVLVATPAKQAHYSLSALPPAFLLVGAAIEGVLEARPRLRRAAPALIVACGAVLLGSRVLRALGAGIPGVRPGEWAAIVAAGVAIVLARPRDPSRRALVPALLVAAALAGVSARVDASRARCTEDYEDAVAALPRSARDGTFVGVRRGDGEAFDAVMAWMDRPWVRERSEDLGEIRARLARGDSFFVLVSDDDAASLAPVESSLRLVAPLAPSVPRPRDRLRLYASRP